MPVPVACFVFVNANHESVTNADVGTKFRDERVRKSLWDHILDEGQTVLCAKWRSGLRLRSGTEQPGCADQRNRSTKSTSANDQQRLEYYWEGPARSLDRMGISRTLFLWVFCAVVSGRADEKIFIISIIPPFSCPRSPFFSDDGCCIRPFFHFSTFV